MTEQIETRFKDYWASQNHDGQPYKEALSGLRAFKDMGIPNRLKDEDWKYTNLKPFNIDEWKPYVSKTQPSLEELSLKLDPSFINIVFYNGYLTYIPDDLKGLYLIKDGQEQLPWSFNNGIEALQAAFSDQLISLKVPKNKVIEKALKVTLVSDARLDGHMVNPSVQLILEQGAALTVLESHEVLGEDRHYPYLSNLRVRGSLGPQARLHYYKKQQQGAPCLHIDHSRFSLEEGAFFETFNLSLGARLSRYDLQISLGGEGCETHLNAVYQPSSGQHVDHQTKVDHKVPHCSSHQLYKGVIYDESRLVFNGKVFIRPGAIGTDAQQLNKNLMMGHHAEVDTKPQMEIDADDVKCSHGATIGKLDPDQTFYLQSRGISKTQAESILAAGFIGEVSEKISQPQIRDDFKKTLREFSL